MSEVSVSVGFEVRPDGCTFTVSGLRPNDVVVAAVGLMSGLCESLGGQSKPASTPGFEELIGEIRRLREEVVGASARLAEARLRLHGLGAVMRVREDTVRAPLAAKACPFERASKDELLAACVPDEDAAVLLASDPKRYREVLLREPFSRCPRMMVVDVSKLPAA